MIHKRTVPMSKKKKLAALCYAFPRTMPVMAGYLVLGAAYGILMNVNGYGIWWALLISVFVSLMLNARHLFYGLSMLDKYKDAGKLKPYLIFSLTDETFSVLCNEEPPEGLPKYWVYFFISILDQLYWVTGAVIGALAGTMITFSTAGMDFALTALFVVIFIDQWKSGKGHQAACVGVCSSALCVAVFGQSVFIVPAMILILIIITAGYFMEKKKEEQP